MTPKKQPADLLKHLRASDLRAAAKLAANATVGITQIAEGVHRSVLGSMGLPGGKEAGRTRGLTGLVYQSIQGVAQLLGTGAAKVLERLEPLLRAADAAAPETPQREALVAALNGVMGDRLLADNNPLATRMALYCNGQPLNLQTMPMATQVGGRLVLLVHGLCMNHLQWHTTREDQVVDHGATLARELGYTPLTLRYNSGLHTSVNGQALALLLEQLLGHWPVPVTELAIVVHSMGGLVTRSAVHAAQTAGMHWPALLRQLIFLGTPHHGAPLERAGNWVDVILGSTPYSRPFARLGQLRSAGITDLRYGHVLDADWQGRDRFARSPDRRTHLPLPAGVACYTVAATTATKRGTLADRLLGDGLVPLRSALGQHDDPARCLVFAKPAQVIMYRMNHMQLLSSPEVGQQIVQWLRNPSEAHDR